MRREARRDDEEYGYCTDCIDGVFFWGEKFMVGVLLVYAFL